MPFPPRQHRYSLRCSSCGISYPTSHTRPCEVCGGGLDGIQGEHDEDWQDKVSMALTAIQESVVDDTVIGWRMRTLIFAGAPVRLAERIAQNREIDLHRAEKIVMEAGPDLAERILL